MHAIAIVDLGFGDAGKGSLVDYYVRRERASVVVRFNGGAQAAHNVVTPDGRHHTFSQFGSGAFVPGVKTHLSRFMLVDPIALLQEEKHLQQVGVPDAFGRLTIDPAAPVVTPFQRAANRLREIQRGSERHGSCGMGIGETMEDLLADPNCIIRAGELGQRSRVIEKLRYLQRWKWTQIRRGAIPNTPQAAQEVALLNDPAAPLEFAEFFGHVAGQVRLASFADHAAGSGTIVFEGAQGVLLDEWYGFHPYTTWSTTTFANVMKLLSEIGHAGQVTRVGAARAYMTRHGPGPFVTEDAGLTRDLADPHNGTNAWQRGFRVGWPDMVMLRYALDVCGGVDELAITCIDRLAGKGALQACRSYEHPISDLFVHGRPRVSPVADLDYQQRMTIALQSCRPIYDSVCVSEYVEWVEDQLGVPVGVTSAGPTCLDKAARRRVAAKHHAVSA